MFITTKRRTSRSTRAIESRFDAVSACLPIVLSPSEMTHAWSGLGSGLGSGSGSGFRVRVGVGVGVRVRVRARVRVRVGARV